MTLVLFVSFSCSIHCISPNMSARLFFKSATSLTPSALIQEVIVNSHPPIPFLLFKEIQPISKRRYEFVTAHRATSTTEKS